MSVLTSMSKEHPVRKTKAQKSAFRMWAKQYCTELGYKAESEEKGFSRNIVIGNPEAAQVVVTAHYDTPPRLPFPNVCTPENKAVFILTQVAMSIGIIAFGALAGALAGWLSHDAMIGFEVGYVALLLLCGVLLFGPANPSCMNDNTSGTAAVLQLLTQIPEAQREKVACILFDNEEKGLLGSAAYASKHPRVRDNTLLINLDCVGDGDAIFCIANKRIRALPAYTILTEAMSRQQGRTLCMREKETCIYPSDQMNFKLGMAICACRRTKIGYCIDKIHTPKDTVCDQQNLDFITGGLTDFINML